MTIQSSIYLSGNKRLLFDNIAPHLNPDDKRANFVDLFTGSGTMILNCKELKMFDNYIGNDSLPQIIDMHKFLQDYNNLDVLTCLNKQYPPTEDGYYQLREDYNKKPCPELLFFLHYRSNTNYIRFNKSGGFNVPWGKRECYDETRLSKHINLVKESVKFVCRSYDKVCEAFLTEDDLSKTTFYIDPPYLKTTTMYTNAWSWMEDDNLRMYCKKLALKGAKIVYSNVLTNRDFTNTALKKWVEDNKEQFTLFHLDRDYSNSSFRKSSTKSDEVLIVSNN
jgi:DNA adenine methylase Dam